MATNLNNKKQLTGLGTIFLATASTGRLYEIYVHTKFIWGQSIEHNMRCIVKLQPMKKPSFNTA